MKRFVIRGSIFLLSLPICWFLVLAICARQPTVFRYLIGTESLKGGTWHRTHEWNEHRDLRQDVDVLFFGSSTCYCGIDPHALAPHGLKGFNFCSSGQRLGTSQLLLSAALSESQPRCVAVDLFPELWPGSPHGVEAARDWALNAERGTSAVWPSAIFENAWSSGNVYNALLAMAQSFNEGMGWRVHSRVNDPLSQYKGLGFVERHYPQLPEAPDCHHPQRLAFREDLCELLNQIRHQCTDASASLVLILPPELCPEPYDRPECWANIPIIDGNEWPGANSPAQYYDEHHLVAAGARSYSDWLSRELLDKTPF